MTAVKQDTWEEETEEEEEAKEEAEEEAPSVVCEALVGVWLPGLLGWRRGGLRKRSEEVPEVVAESRRPSGPGQVLGSCSKDKHHILLITVWKT